MAERLKHSESTPLEVVVGVAHVVAQRVADLTHPATLQYFQTTGATHRISELLHPLGIAGPLVPAAIAMTPQKYPRMRLARDGLRVVYDTPDWHQPGFVSHRYQEFRELERYHAILQGLTR